MVAQPAAIGLSTHSGWAALIVLAGGAPDLSVLARSRIALIDDRDLESKHPYHAVESLGVEEAAARLRGYFEIATALGQAAIETHCKAASERGYQVKSIGIIDSTGRRQSSLSSILKSHALIHAAEGDHFRNALSAAAESNGIGVCRVPARALEDHAEGQLRLPRERLLETVKSLGRQVGAPWGADQKNAALLAWTLLAKGV